MKKILQYPLLLAIILISACNTAKQVGASSGDGKIEINFVQINDVYEISPLEGGKVGGIARVASIKKLYQAANPNTLLVLAGDFLSPSVYNSLKFEGSRIRGRQMVDALNTAGLDLAVFGNHEFDISEAELQSRINESKFQWLSSNTFHKKGNDVVPFEKQTAGGDEPFPETIIKEFTDQDGTRVKIGFISVTLPFNKAAYVSYTDVFTAAQAAYDKIKDSCEAVIAITHQLMADDIKLAKQIPGLAMIMGGHEHERHFAKIGNVYITKADANAKSAYIINLTIDTKRKMRKVEANITDLNETILPDSATNVVVKKWTDYADNNYASLGFDAHKIALPSGDPLDGREGYIREMQTNFTKLIVAAMEKASPTADVAIINSGSIRVDDILHMPVTQYDVIRSLPFGGSIMEADMKGSLLIKILDVGLMNRGSGGFLQYSSKLAHNSISGAWTINNTPVDKDKVYKVSLSDFLLTGGESNLGFLKKDNPEIVKVYPVYTDMKDPRSDIRRAIINYMEGL